MSFDFPFKKGSGIPLLTTSLSPQCLSLLHAMVAYDPDERITAHQALQHPYFQGQRWAPCWGRGARGGDRGCGGAGGDTRRGQGGVEGPRGACGGAGGGGVEGPRGARGAEGHTEGAGGRAEGPGRAEGQVVPGTVPIPLGTHLSLLSWTFFQKEATVASGRVGGGPVAAFQSRSRLQC